MYFGLGGKWEGQNEFSQCGKKKMAWEGNGKEIISFFFRKGRRKEKIGKSVQNLPGMDKNSKVWTILHFS